jgi:asparagine synthase (glutamine-hydrolysing)
VCGICGLATTKGPVDQDRLAAMAQTLFHRGPDSEGRFVEGGIGLAARRLAIIDLAAGDQPIANEDGTVTVVQNGEIYNYRELLAELERLGHRFRTRCDTEVHVHAYEQWGTAYLERLRGMFAVALWDARERRLLLARDRFGIKPLYVRDVGGELSFASELDALPRGEIDLDAVEAFLATNSIPAPLSIYREIRKLPGTSCCGETARQPPNGSPVPDRCRSGRTTTRPSCSRSAAPGCAIPSAPTWSQTCRSASCSPAASTRAPSPRSRPRSRPHRYGRYRSGWRTPRSTS